MHSGVTAGRNRELNQLFIKPTVSSHFHDNLKDVNWLENPKIDFLDALQGYTACRFYLLSLSVSPAWLSSGSTSVIGTRDLCSSQRPSLCCSTRTHNTRHACWWCNLLLMTQLCTGMHKHPLLIHTCAFLILETQTHTHEPIPLCLF